MKLSLIGPGDIEFHYHEILKIPKQEFSKELEKIAKAIVDSEAEIELLPDIGISFEIAKLYKEKNGKKVIGTIPKSDNIFGITHLKKSIETKINNKPLFDEIIDTDNWFKHDLIKGLLGDAILYLGSSPGTNGELNYAVYLYKLIYGNKKGIVISGKSIHPNIKAGKDFTIFVYSHFLLNKRLDRELEEYIKKYNIRLIYINDPEQLKKELVKFT